MDDGSLEKVICKYVRLMHRGLQLAALGHTPRVASHSLEAGATLNALGFDQPAGLAMGAS